MQSFLLFRQIPCNAKALVKMLTSLCRLARARAALSSPDADSTGMRAACGPARAAALASSLHAQPPPACRPLRHCCTPAAPAAPAHRQPGARGWFLAGWRDIWDGTALTKQKQDPKMDVAARHFRNEPGFILNPGCVTAWRNCKKRGILQK